MTKKAKSISAWLLILLFATYASSNALFIHIHIVDDVIYVHSHPYHTGETDSHDHTSEQLVLLDFHNQTSYDNHLFAHSDQIIHRPFEAIIYTDIHVEPCDNQGLNNHPLRAPPVRN